MQSNTLLAQEFHAADEPLFNHTIKFHYALQVARMAAYLNPRLLWCYRGEDMMSKVEVLCRSCTHGSKPSLIVDKAMDRYTRGRATYLSKYKKSVIIACV